MPNTRVVITGLGVVSSIGIGKDEFWSNLIAGRSGISRIELFDTSKHKRHYGGEIKNFDPAGFIPPKKIRFYGRASQFAIAATKLAIEDAGIHLQKLRAKRTAVAIGATMPEGSTLDHSSEQLITNKSKGVTSNNLLNNFPPSICRNIGLFFKIRGNNLLIPCACAAGNYCIGYGFDLIRNNKADMAIVGGAEALSRVAFQGFQRIYAMAPETCSPFDKERKGMLLGEAAGTLIIETLDSALQRNAPIYAEILGYGLSCDAFHITIPKRTGIKKAIEKALKESTVASDQVDYISAHGTGTGQNDKEESNAVNEIFRGKKIPISSIKSMIGHTMGAAAAVEAIACCLAMKYNIAPPTINFKTPDPDCDVDCVPNKARGIPITIAMNNSFAFGGNDSCLILKKTNEQNK